MNGMLPIQPDVPPLIPYVKASMAGVEWKWILSLISLTAVNMLLRRHLSSLSKLQDHLQILSFSTPNIEALCQKSPSNIFIIFRELESYHQTWGVHSGID